VACREGIALATDLNIGAVTIASDYLEVVQGLRGETWAVRHHPSRDCECFQLPLWDVLPP
jgi:hypothetical protein